MVYFKIQIAIQYHPWLSEINAPFGYHDMPMNGCFWLANSVIVSGDPTYTELITQDGHKMDINQSTVGIGGRVSEFLVPNRCINFW